MRNAPFGVVAAAILVIAAGLYTVVQAFSGLWPPLMMLRHWAAVPNCTAARMVGLAPARRGEPGYYVHHDADSDGVACEPWPRPGVQVIRPSHR